MADSTSTLAALLEREERRLCKDIQHERAMNRAYERRCPGVQPNQEYASGARPASQFYTVRDRLSYLVTREREKFHPSPTVARSTPRTCGRR